MTNTNSTPDLRAMARQAMMDAGLVPDFPPEVIHELRSLNQTIPPTLEMDSIKDLRALLWSSIDNKESKDLDQVEYVERLPDGSLRILIGIADVDAFVPKESAIDHHAFVNTVSVYTPAIIFPMLPEQLSTGITSLLEGEDRLAVIIDLVMMNDGEISSKQVYRALVRNRAKLTYEEVGEWLEGRATIPDGVTKVVGLEAQISLQNEATEWLRALRRRNGALELETVESVPVLSGGEVVGLEVKRHNRAQDIIESFMVAANTSMAEYLESKGVPSLRRVVRTPERWSRIVDLARSMGENLPTKPNSRALADFLVRRRQAEPEHYPELSLSVLKLLGSGEYRVEAPGLEQEGHFGLAVHDYTHSTAPNRRYPDLVTQRSLKASIAGNDPPYTRTELEAIAERCNRMEDAARKVERTMRKAAAAVLLHKHIGEVFEGIVTGVTPKGTFARLIDPPAEGRIIEGERGLDVGDRIRVRLLSTNPERGFIDLARLGSDKK